jgi:PAS domain S-box-containing protein
LIVEIFITRIEIENEIIFSSFIRDISLRKQAEQELIASENKLSLLVQSLPVLPFTMDYFAPYEFIYLNERVEALLGYNESNVKSLKGFWISKVHPDDVSELIDNWLNYDSNQQKVFTYRIQHASGNWRWIRETSRLIIDDSGTPMSISGVFNDITQQKETEDRRQKVEKTLYEISREEKLSTDSLNGLYDLISNSKHAVNKKIYYIHGNIKAEEREEIRKAMETEHNVILIGSVGTVSTGTNIKNLHNIIFASPSKSRIRNLQAIGRVLRLNENKDEAILYDLADDLRYKKRENYTLTHFQQRIKIYNEEKFDYKIIKVDMETL